MIIKKIEIDNFRSYYRSNVFEFANGMNLIIGSNGDGKTTFYEALEWLFLTDGTRKMDEKYISKKRSEELFENQSDDVRVSMTYEHNGIIKTLEKMFHFTKSLDDSISMSSFSFNLMEERGGERIQKDGSRFDIDLPVEIRKYIMFKGESELDVFQRSNALKMLVDTFSDVKDFEAYDGFMELAVSLSKKASDKAETLDRKNVDRIRGYKSIVNQERAILAEIEREIRQKESEATNFEDLLKNLEQSREASKLLIATNRRIETLENQREEKRKLIKEDYTIYLLDDLWILLGFEDIANEYSDKVNAVDRERRKQEQAHIVSTVQEKTRQEFMREVEVIKEEQEKNPDFIPLPVHVPGRKIMEEMLEEEVCKICGRPAKKHSEAWEYMLHRLEEFNASLKKKGPDDEVIDPLFVNDFIGELQKRETSLNDNLDKITKMRHVIQDRIALNNRLRDDIKKIEANISQEYETKKRILAQTDDLTEEQLTANYSNISNWMDQKHKAENRIGTLKEQRAKHREKLDEAEDELSKLAEGTTASMYIRTAAIIRNISEAFKNAKEVNKKRLLHAIEDEANAFLEMLNTNDFKGTIRILERADGQGEAVLMNNDNTRIFNPNTALRTTYLMSVLFAIGKLSTQRKETEFPLVFDAPTSSFTDVKESEFFNVIGGINKQVIIVTKSFLKEGSGGELVLDRTKINGINGRVFRIEKKKPFDDKKLGTIQTVISKIK